MKRCLTTLAAGLLVYGATTAAEPSKKVTIRWHGQSFFEIISSKGTRIATDPHFIEAFGRTHVSADLVTMSHPHNDHTMIDVIENRNRAKVLQGFKTVGKKVDWNLIEEKFRDVHVSTVGVYHDVMKGTERGKNTVFVFEVDGLRIVHLGDLGHLLSDEQVKQIGAVDVLMIPVGGVYTINGTEARQVLAQLKPRRYILPMHYGTKNFDAVLPADEFLDDQKKENVKRLATNELIVDTNFKPAAPVIVLLHWRNESERPDEGK